MDTTPIEILVFWGDPFIDPFFNIFKRLKMLGWKIILNCSKQMIIRWRYIFFTGSATYVDEHCHGAKLVYHASKDLSSIFFDSPERSLSLRSKSPLWNRLNQSLHVVSDRACSSYVSWSEHQWISAALFFK